jgi:hypothetical protein
MKIDLQNFKNEILIPFLQQMTTNELQKIKNILFRTPQRVVLISRPVKF